MRRLAAILTLAIVPLIACAADPAPNVKATIERGLAFVAKDNLTFKENRKCIECHHAPFTVWALNEGKKQGYAVDEKAFTEMTSYVVSKDYLGRLPALRPKQAQVLLSEAPLLLALALEAGDTKAVQQPLKQMLTSVLEEQDKDGSWKLGNEMGLPLTAASTAGLLGSPFGSGPLAPASALFPTRFSSNRPIGPAPATLTTLALLALTAPNAPDMGEQGKVVREKALKRLREVKFDEDLQATALRLVLWRRLGQPAAECEPLVKTIRGSQNTDGGWSQIKGAKSDAYATGQALYALAEAGAKPNDEAVRKAQAFLAKTQREDGSWPMVSRAILPGTGAPSKNLGPITHAGSSWAVIGLAHSAPATTKSGSTASK